MHGTTQKTTGERVKAVVVGPGRIGCGLAGQVLAAAGAEITFIGRGATIAQLKRAGRYRVRLTDGRSVEEHEVVPARALSVEDPDAPAAIAAADVVLVSVGAQGLAAIAPLLAAGLARRTTPVNVIALENMADAGRRLAWLVGARLPADGVRHGFSGAVVSRIVARRIGDPAGDAPLVYVGDPIADVVVDGAALRAPLPAIPGFQVVPDFDAWYARKLFIFSAGHAAAAYLGKLKGYHYVHSAIRDPEVRAHVLAAMEEGRRGVEAEYGADVAGRPEDLQKIVARFDNATLNDPVSRVGRDPGRKLSSGDRIVGAARLAERAGIRPKLLALVAAAALCFDVPGDPSSDRLRDGIARQGVPATLREVAGLEQGAELGRAVADAFLGLADGQGGENLLLSLERRVWTWRRAAVEDDRLTA
jgi:mannitol-1-phosphate 5-dehydrogenase